VVQVLLKRLCNHKLGSNSKRSNDNLTRQVSRVLAKALLISIHSFLGSSNKVSQHNLVRLQEKLGLHYPLPQRPHLGKLGVQLMELCLVDQVSLVVQALMLRDNNSTPSSRDGCSSYVMLVNVLLQKDSVR